MKTTYFFSTCSALLAGALFALPAAADINDLLEMSEKLDKIEKQDFGDAIDKANGCTRARDFACTSSWLGKATKLANGSRDKQVLAAAQQNMANEKARIAEEERQRAEEQRRIAEAEERLRVAEAEAARRANESSGPSTGAQLFQLGMAIAGNVYAEKARLAAAAANSGRSQSSGLPLADLSAERRAIEKARADAAAAQRAREQANASRLASANTAAPTARAAAPSPFTAAQDVALRDSRAAQMAGLQAAPAGACPPGYTWYNASGTGAPGDTCYRSADVGNGSGTSAAQPGSSPTKTASSGSSGSSRTTGPSNTGGSSNSGGYTNTNGSSNTGGYTSNGGSSNTGGYTNSGGSSSTTGPSNTGRSSNTRVADNTGGGSSTTGGGYPGAGGDGDRPLGGSQPKKLYPLIRHFTYPTLGNTQQDACAEATKQIDEHIARGALGRIVSRSSCSCTKEKDIYGWVFLCKIPITDELMVDYDPNAPTSNTSR